MELVPLCRAEINPYPITEADKVFFEKVKRAVLSDDVKWLSEAISYPVVLRLSGGSVELKSQKDFLDHSGIILSKRLKSAVRDQSSESLFKNWRGVMIGNGEIWFSTVAQKSDAGESWVQLITGINPEDSSEKESKPEYRKKAPK